MQRFRLRTKDPGLAASSVNSLFGSPLRFETEPAKDFQCELDGFVTRDSFTVARLTLPADTRIDSGELPALAVSYARSGTPKWRVGAQEGTFDIPLLLPPLRSLEMSNSGHYCETVTVGFGTDALEQHVGASQSRILRGPALSAPRGAAGVLGAFLAYVGATLDLTPEVFDVPLVRAGLIDAAMSLIIASFDFETHDDREGSPSMPRTLRRAISFIDDNLGDPITVADIAAAAHLSVRGLQGLFERDLGITPTHYLRRARLHAVRNDLLAADAGSTRIADVARRWGFIHLPRFAQEYRAEFGELPSTTRQG